MDTIKKKRKRIFERGEDRRDGHPFVPTDEMRAQVEALAAFNIPIERMCDLIINPTTAKPISKPTLIKHFRHELDNGKAKAVAAVANVLYNMATTEGHPNQITAAIFYLKTQGRWRESSQVEMSGPDGAPIETVNTNTNMTMEQRAAKLAQLLNMAKHRKQAADYTDDEEE